tara:strand:+ start:291 stop:476 length:186 start_codon:yes stop_codon:yes gene_type:complete
MENKYEMEISLNHEFEVMYHTFNDLTKINEELKYIMNLEEKIPMNLITQIRIYKLNTKYNG